jgi:YfiR/HmsC-like
MCSKNFIFTLWGTLIVVLTLALSVRADEPAREYKVKAAFIYNFAQFVDWPTSAFESADAPFVVAVVGKDPFNGLLEEVVAGKRVGGRTVVVQHFDSSAGIGQCQILFVPMTEEGSLGTIIQKMQNKPVLTIGEVDDFTEEGGCFRFFTEDNKMRFEINQDAAEQAGLRISSKLLRLARIFKK